MYKKYSLLACLLLAPALITASAVIFSNDSENVLKIDNRNKFFGSGMEEVLPGQTVTIAVNGVYNWVSETIFNAKVPAKFDVYVYVRAPEAVEGANLIDLQPLDNVIEKAGNEEPIVLLFSQLQNAAINAALKDLSHGFLHGELALPVTVKAVAQGQFIADIVMQDALVRKIVAQAISLGNLSGSAASQAE